MFLFPISNEFVIAAWFLMAGSLVVLVYLLLHPRADPVHRRLDDLTRDDPIATPTALRAGGRPAAVVSELTPTHLEEQVTRRLREQQRQDRLHQRLLQAGFYSSSIVVVFYGFRVALALTPAALGLLAGVWGIVSLWQGLWFGVLVGLAGTFVPILWLNFVRRARQTRIRRALPDALDVMAVCLQGGLSLGASLALVARELAMAHPTLAIELNIMEKQIQMGGTTGDAFRQMASRFDLDELRSMASVITQAERIGASVAGALEVFAESLRVKRYQQAEELAHKASVKMLFPTLFFIFPAIFVVLLAPAAVQIYRQLFLGVMQGQH